MTKYIFALLTWLLLWQTDETDNLKLVPGAFVCFVIYSILFYKELI